MSFMTLDTKLLKLLDDKGWTQRELVRRLQAASLEGSKSKSTVSRWLKGEGRPGLDECLVLARILNSTVDYLADDNLDEPPPPELSPDEKLCLKLIRDMGTDEARRRLAQIPLEDRKVEVGRPLNPPYFRPNSETEPLPNEPLGHDDRSVHRR